ncbi:MAG: efflux transporter outer membrane subunit [Desulfobacterales bacterium]|nr:efflux transporter outer membrane subunit [Desulfobacterales bacterium]
MVLLAACAAVGPDYIPPEVSPPAQWSAELERGLTAERVDTQALASWWSTFNDPTLTSLVERAIKGNLDLRQASSRVLEARARRGISEADRFPTVKASGSAKLSRSSEETGSGSERDLYAAGFDATWELDLFGGRQRAIEAAEAELQASEEDLRDVLVSLLAEVALNYVDVRSFQARLSVTEANIDALKETYNITQWRFQAGLTTQLDVEQAKYNLEQARSRIPGLQTGLEQAKNRLAVLLGDSPGSVRDELSGREPIPVTPLEIAVGVPAEVLRRRPDVRRAERGLAAQTARIGVATAELYPKFTLLGSIGFEALSLGKLFSTGARFYGLGPSATWTVFDAGRIRRNIEVQNVLQENALLEYEAAILTALEDVENALVAYAKEQVRRQSLIDASQASQRAVDLARSQYLSGVTDFQSVLDAQHSLLSLKDQLAESEGKVTSNLIMLYKALGGGWTSLAPDEKNRF